MPLTSKQELEEAILIADSNKKNIRDLGIYKRAQLLMEASRTLEDNSEFISNLVRLETGKSIQMARAETKTAIEFMKNLAGASVFQDGISIPSNNPRKSIYTRKIPFGLAALITSFNTPMPNFAWKFAPSFLAGNISFIKPSEFTSLSAFNTVKLLIASGIPSEALFLCLGDKTTGEALVDSNVNLLSFTGSYLTGIAIANNPSGKLRKNILELGGSNPFILCKSGDIDKAIPFILQSAFSNAGQRCASGSRVIVHADQYQVLVDKLMSELSKVTIGVGDSCFFGPLIDEKAVLKAGKYLSELNNLGIQYKQLGIVEDLGLNLFQPTLVLAEESRNDLLFEEVFSPILRIFKFNQIDDAIKIANNANYGLTAAIWTNEQVEEYELIQNVNAGVININGFTHGAEFQFPFGGLKSSGNGTRETGIDSLSEYSELQVISRLYSE